MSKSKVAETRKQYRKPYREKKVLRNYVYFIQDGNGYTKIGFTDNPKRRMTILQSAASTELKLLFILPSENASQLEKRFHQHLAQYRKLGEWFDLPQSEIDKIAAFYNVKPVYASIAEVDNVLWFKSVDWHYAEDY